MTIGPHRRRDRPAACAGGSKLIVLACAVAAFCLSPRGVLARQEASGVVAGTVTGEADGRAVAGATVILEGAATGLSPVGVPAPRVTSDTRGRFRLEGLAPGQVALAVEAPGFRELRVPDVVVGAGKTVELDLELVRAPSFMERIQVTATKAPLSIGELAAQADIVDRETIDLRGDQQLTSAIAHLPGLVVSTQAGSFESVTLRGLPRDGNEFTSTLLLIDGVPQTDSRNSARVVNLPLNDAGTIEVLRGPSSALYGRTAIGGSVNLLTADPTVDHQLGLDLTGGDFATLKGLARASGPAAAWGGYYVSGSHEESDGWYTGDVDVEVDRWALFGKLAFVPDARSSGSFSANVVDSDQGTPTNVPIIDGRLLSEIDPRFDRLRNLNLPGPNYHQEEDRYTGSYTRQLGAASSLVALLGYREIVYQFIDDGDVIGGPFDLAAGTLTMYPFEQRTTEDISYSELRFELELPGERVESSLLAGGSYESTGGFTAGNLLFTDDDTLGWPLDYLDPIHPPRSAWSFFRIGGSDYDLGSTGLFAQYVVEPADRWVIVAGGRYDRLDLDNTLTFATGQPRVDDTFDEVSPRASVTYKLVESAGRPDVSLYASYSEAFLPPRRPGQLRPADAAIELEPEDIASWELGLKGSFLEHRLAAAGALFRMRRDGIVTTVREGPLFRPSNAGEHEYEGFEASLHWKPAARFSGYVNAALYDNRFGDFVIQSAGGDRVLTGNRLPISPDQVFNAGAVIRPARAWDVAVDVKHVGDVMIDIGNTFELDAYTLVDTAVSWRRERPRGAGWAGTPVRLTLQASNLLDEEYFWNGDISVGESADPGRPRMVLLTAAFSFSGGR
ncbi:MAG TPA: TonB-dependent receptor [Thermoanaerobaculia bacterium]|nr:TonB-dependent receptor [Thermoanaerobaculia bacterium]